MPGQEHYYLNNPQLYETLVSDMEKYFTLFIGQYFSAEETREIINQAHTAFLGLLPELPYIGGPANRLTRTLLEASYELGIYDELEKRGLSLGEISVINQKAKQAILKAELTPEKLEHLKNVLFSKEYLQEQARESQERIYPGNWVFECVEPGPHDTFDLGVTYTECAVANLYKNKGKERYLPYICINDFPVYGERKIFFERSGSLGYGDACCDFRYWFNSEKLTGIVECPEDLPEFKKVRSGVADKTK